MNAPRLGLRAGRHLRTPAIRSALQRRFASDKTELTGAADNAFNRERAAVKAHARLQVVNNLSSRYQSEARVYPLTLVHSDLWRRLSI